MSRVPLEGRGRGSPLGRLTQRFRPVEIAIAEWRATHRAGHDLEVEWDTAFET